MLPARYEPLIAIFRPEDFDLLDVADFTRNQEGPTWFSELRTEDGPREQHDCREGW